MPGCSNNLIHIEYVALHCCLWRRIYLLFTACRHFCQTTEFGLIGTNTSDLRNVRRFIQQYLMKLRNEMSSSGTSESSPPTSSITGTPASLQQQPMSSRTDGDWHIILGTLGEPKIDSIRDLSLQKNAGEARDVVKHSGRSRLRPDSVSARHDNDRVLAVRKWEYDRLSGWRVRMPRQRRIDAFETQDTVQHLSKRIFPKLGDKWSIQSETLARNGLICTLRLSC